jgi:ankyrin repeat protein
LRSRTHPVRGQGSAHLGKSHDPHLISSPPDAADTGRRREVAVNLEQLRKQAKELLKGARADDADAVRRLGGREPILANAQLALAREQGYASWPALVAAAEASVETFVQAATQDNRARADAFLAARPEIERDPWARLVLGHRWEGDPNRPGGPLNWAPILYVSHSAYAKADLARELLSRGADPNATFTNEYGEMSALYGAAGVVHDAELTRILLEAGADPNDGESVYHSLEANDPACLRLLLEHGAETRGTNGLAHALDYDRIEQVRMLLEAGADPNEGALLAHAVRRGRGPEFLQLLVDHGAELDALGGETWRGDVPLRTAYQHAVLRNRTDNAELLAKLGASTELDLVDASIAAVARGEEPNWDVAPFGWDPDRQEVIILAALTGNIDAVVRYVGANFHGVVGGSPDGTLLHHAAWMAKADAVRELLARGADPNRASRADFETPLAWAVWASAHRAFGDWDYVAVAEPLVEAGAKLEPRFLESAAGPLLEWLELRVPGEL